MFKLEQSVSSGKTKCSFCKGQIVKGINVGLLSFFDFNSKYQRRLYWHIDCIKRQLNMNLPDYFHFTPEEIQKDYMETKQNVETERDSDSETSN